MGGRLSRCGDNMRIGSLVMYLNDGDLGIIVEVDPCNGMLRVHWFSAWGYGWQLESELELVCE